MFDFEFFRDNWLYIATGTGATLSITIISLLLATPIAILVARGRRSPLLPITVLSSLYVWLINGIPLLLQIPFVFLALPQIGIVLSGFLGGVSVLTLNYGARMSKIFYERIAANGKSPSQTWTALIQPLTDEFTSMIKDSTLISLSGFISDIYWRAHRVGRAEFRNLEALAIASIIYLILITIISLGAKWFKLVIKNTHSGAEGYV